MIDFDDKIKRTLLVESNIKAINSACYKYRFVMDEIALQNCILHGTWNCLQKHDPKFKTKFSSSLYNHIQWECKSYLKQERPRHSRGFKSLSSMDVECPENAQLQHEIRDCLSQLDGPDKELLEQYYFYNLTLEEIGKKHGYSKQAAGKKVVKAEEAFKRLWNMSYYVSRKS